MTGFVLFALIYFIFCTLFFEVIQKPFFGLYNRHVNAEKTTAKDIAQVYSHGLVSDFIIASYLTALPLIVSAIHTLLPCFNVAIVLTVYNIIISLAVGLICVSDTLLYKFWNYKLDSSVFVYLHSLKGAFASVSASLSSANASKSATSTLPLVAFAPSSTCTPSFFAHSLASASVFQLS